MGLCVGCQGTEPLESGFLDTDTGPPEPTTSCSLVTPGTEAEGWFRVVLADHPELDTIYNGVQISLGGTTVNLAKVTEDCWVAMGVRCTHEGGPVTYRPARNQFVCSRHGAIFGPDGVPVAGPTGVPMPLFEVGFDGTDLWVKVD